MEQASPKAVCRACAPNSVNGASQSFDGQNPDAQRVLEPGNHFLITDMLQQVVRSGTARRAQQLTRADLAGKTGTTNDFRDAWFSGFNQDVVTTVWVGFDDSSTLGRREAGSKAALPIWIDYMKIALDDTKPHRLIPPDNVVSRFVDKDSGKVVMENDPNGYQEYFLVSNAPRELPQVRIPGVTAESINPAVLPAPSGPTEGLF